MSDGNRRSLMIAMGRPRLSRATSSDEEELRRVTSTGRKSVEEEPE